MNTTDAVKLKNINMLNDAIFKSLFRSSEAREMVSDFLNEILGIDKQLIMKAEFQGGELTKKVLTEKGKASDIIIKIEDNNKIILEMNQFDNDNIFRKNIDYVFTLATESTKVGKKTYPNVVMISFDNFNKLKTDKPILHFKLRDEYGNIESDQYNSIHLILENIENGKYNVGKETRKLIKLLRQTTIEEMEKEFKGDEIYMACVRRVEELSTDPDFIGYYDIEEARRQENEDFEMTGFRKGREAGHAEGKYDKQIEIAKNLLSKNISIESISEITGLSIEEMESEFKDNDDYISCVRRLEEARHQENEDFEMTGFRKGKEKTQIEIAKEMLKDNIDMKKISKYTSLSIEEINNLSNN